MLDRLRKNRRGLILDWYVWFVTVGTFLICYFAVLPLCEMLMDVGVNAMPNNANALQTIALFRNVILWVGVVVVVGMLVWILAVSRKREYLNIPA